MLQFIKEPWHKCHDALKAIANCFHLPLKKQERSAPWFYSKSKGQTGIEAMLVTGVIITLLVVLGAFYFGDVSDQTTAIIILKTELLKQFSSLSKSYVISSTLEPSVLSGEILCFEVRTSPELNSTDKAILTADDLPEDFIKKVSDKISQRTKYKTVKIKIEDVCA